MVERSVGVELKLNTQDALNKIKQLSTEIKGVASSIDGLSRKKIAADTKQAQDQIKLQGQAAREQLKIEKEQVKVSREKTKAEQDKTKAIRETIKAEQDKVKLEREQEKLSKDKIKTEREQFKLTREKAREEERAAKQAQANQKKLVSSLKEAGGAALALYASFSKIQSYGAKTFQVLSNAAKQAADAIGISFSGVLSDAFAQEQKMEQAAIGFRNLFSDINTQADVKNLQSRLRQLAIQSPGLAAGDLADYVRQLAPVSTGSEQAINATMGLLKAIQYGGGEASTEMEYIIKNIRDVMSKGTATAVDIRQFQRAIPILSQALEDVGASEFLKDGELNITKENARQIMSAFEKLNTPGTALYDIFSETANTLGGLKEQLSESVVTATTELFERTGVFTLIKELLRGLQNNGDLFAWLEEILRGLIETINEEKENIKAFVGEIWEEVKGLFGGDVKGMVKAVLEFLKGFVRGLVDGAKLVKGFAKGITDLLKKFGIKVEDSASALGKFLGWMAIGGGLVKNIIAVLLSVAGILGSAYILIKSLTAIASATLLPAIKAVVAAINPVTAGLAALVVVLGLTTNAAKDLKDASEDAANSMRDATDATFRQNLLDTTLQALKTSGQYSAYDVNSEDAYEAMLEASKSITRAMSPEEASKYLKDVYMERLAYGKAGQPLLDYAKNLVTPGSEGYVAGYTPINADAQAEIIKNVYASLGHIGLVDIDESLDKSQDILNHLQYQGWNVKSVEQLTALNEAMGGYVEEFDKIKNTDVEIKPYVVGADGESYDSWSQWLAGQGFEWDGSQYTTKALVEMEVRANNPVYKNMYSDANKSFSKGDILGGIGNVVGGTISGVFYDYNPLHLLGWFNKGGMVKPIYRSGGSTSFEKGVDTVPAMLTPGEYVMKTSAVNKAGIGVMNALNRGDLSYAMTALGSKIGNSSWYNSRNWSNSNTHNDNSRRTSNKITIINKNKGSRFNSYYSPFRNLRALG